MEIGGIVLTFALLTGAGVVRADEVTVYGAATGDLGGVSQLTFQGNEFNATTARGIGFFNGRNKLGTFTLPANISATLGGTFTLKLVVTSPTGVSGGRAVITKTGTLQGSQWPNGQAGVWIHFPNPAAHVNFDSGNANGSFKISIADVSLQAGHSAALVGVLTGAQQSDTRCNLQFIAAMATPHFLDPDLKKLTPVVIKAVASDNPGCELSCKIISVASNQPQGPDGDWQITGDLTVNLRADRLSSGNGRLYTATIQCTDNTGTSITQKAPVAVIKKPRGRR